MSAAATAAGYLYASGRLRGRGAREQENETEHGRKDRKERVETDQPAQPREPIRVAVMPSEESKPRKTPKVEYRVRRRWSPAS